MKINKRNQNQNQKETKTKPNNNPSGHFTGSTPKIKNKEPAIRMDVGQHKEKQKTKILLLSHRVQISNLSLKFNSVSTVSG